MTKRERQRDEERNNETKRERDKAFHENHDSKGNTKRLPSISSRKNY